MRQWRKSGKKPRIVVDTNLCVSGLIKTDSIPAKVFDAIPRRKFILCLSQTIFNEYTEVIHRFTKISKNKRDKFLGRIKHHSLWVRPSRSINVSKDPDDNIFIECAAEAKANFIVTGDRILLDVESFEGIDIISLNNFVDIVNLK